MNNRNNDNYMDRMDYKRLRELFGADAALPESTEKRIKNVCAGLEDRPERRGTGVFVGTVSRRAAAAAAALVIIAGAGTALAAGAAHGKLFQTVMGTGVSDNSDDRVYYDGFGEAHEFALFEREEADEATAEAVLGRYIVSLDRQVKSGGTTFTFRDFVMDENGIGYVSYTVEDPAGLQDIIGRYESGSEVYIDTEKSGVPQPYIACCAASLSPDSRTVINDSLSTDTEAYIVEIFAFQCPLSKVGEMSVRCAGEKIPLPIDAPVPARKMTSADGQHKISLSPLGMTAECPAEGVDECITNELYVGDYTVISDEQNINNTYFSARWGVDRGEGEEAVPCTVTSYVFNRLVIPDKVDTVELKTKHTKPVEMTEQPAPYGSNTEGLQSEAENPFHFAYKGAEVYVLTRDTIENCSEEDLKQFAVFEHGAGSYEILIAKDESFERFASRAYMLERCRLPAGEDMITAAEAIDEYLYIRENYFPEYRDKPISIIVELYEYENVPESGARYSWRISRSDITAEIDAVTGRLISPYIPGYNGHVDEDINEWVYD